VSRLGVVTGLTAEARCLRPAGPRSAIPIICSSGDPAQAEDGARRLVRDGVEALLSFGIAGGLDPRCGAGDLVLGKTVVDAAGVEHEADMEWRNRLSTLLAGLGPEIGTVAGCDRPASTVVEKRAIHERCGAIAVDMESHVVARVAADRGLPFAVIRVIADGAHDSLPHAALAGLGGVDGSPRIGSVLGALVLRPWELPGLIRVALETRQALGVLRRCAVDGAPLFGRG
jgi:hopanoid-associated phosphorylase